MQEKETLPQEIMEISRRMKVVYLGQSTEPPISWMDLPTYTIGKRVNVEEMLENRWLEYDEALGF